MRCEVLMFQPIYHVSVSPTDGNGPTQGRRKTLTRVGIEPTTFGFDHRCSTDWATRSDWSRSGEMKMLMARQWICRYKEGLRVVEPIMRLLNTIWSNARFMLTCAATLFAERWSNTSDSTLLNSFLNGSSLLTSDKNKELFFHVQRFIIESKRFKKGD